MLTVQYPENRIRNLLDLRAIPLHARRRQGSDAARRGHHGHARSTSPTEIDHYQIRRVIDIYVTPAGEDLGTLADAIRRRSSAGTTLPAGVTVDMRGMVQGMQRLVHAASASACILALVLLYLILVAQFRSFVDPVAHPAGRADRA